MNEGAELLAGRKKSISWMIVIIGSKESNLLLILVTDDEAYRGEWRRQRKISTSKSTTGNRTLQM